MPTATRSPLAALVTMAALTAFILSGLVPAAAEAPLGTKYLSKKGAFDDVLQDVKDAVINRGLLIDYIGHIDKMLDRTSEAADSVTSTGSRSPYQNAKYLHFCSSKLTHEAISANPYNLSICPYVVFLFETKAKPGIVVVGYRRPIPGPSVRSKKALAKIDSLLESIIKEATQE